MRSLVIVESPAKAKTISKILGGEYTVKASVGHIKDLPAKNLGVNVDKDFTPQYIVIPGKEKIIKELKKASSEAQKVYLAPDPDREGEAIAYHIATEIADKKAKGLNGRIFRVSFNEITETAVRDAIKNPRKIDMSKVDAQQARRILDRLVGYGLSPLLWRKVRRGLSAGRVQSVAVKLIVDRQRVIEAFIKEEYWSIDILLEGSKAPSLPARLYKFEGKAVINREAPEGQRFLITNGEAAGRVADAVAKGNFALKSIDKKLRKRMPQPPFITSTLQQEASRKLRFPAKKTMLIAQQLYEGIDLGKEEGPVGLITYMRTDSVRVASEAQDWARKFVAGCFGEAYVPAKPPHYKSKASAQEAHEAVRPTYMEKTPDSLKKFLTKDHHNLYSLIWNRFIASQMKPAELEQTTFEIISGDPDAVLRATGTVVRFNGFMALYTEGLDEIEEEEGGLLPDLKEGERLNVIRVSPNQHFTQPPPKYTEASLVKALEEKGIGRPSTYATILSTIQDRKYITKEEGRFSPTELGAVVNDLLVERFPELIDIDFTAKLEDELDSIESGRLNWVKVVRDFYKPFFKELSQAMQIPGKVRPEDIPTDIKCELCGSPMVIRWGRHGRFMACSGYPNCKNTMPLKSEEDKKQQAVETNEVCEKCGSPMLLKTSRFGKFLACSKYPECKNTRPLATGVKCPIDGGDLVERRSKKGGRKFWSCNNYPGCKFATWYMPVKKQCPGCKAEFLLEKRDKEGTVVYFCHNKECGYKEEVGQETEETAT
jgi:DNA topoisomerase-1